MGDPGKAVELRGEEQSAALEVVRGAGLEPEDQALAVELYSDAIRRGGGIAVHPLLVVETVVRHEDADSARVAMRLSTTLAVAGEVPIDGHLTEEADTIDALTEVLQLRGLSNADIRELAEVMGIDVDLGGLHALRVVLERLEDIETNELAGLREAVVSEDVEAEAEEAAQREAADRDHTRHVQEEVREELQDAVHAGTDEDAPAYTISPEEVAFLKKIEELVEGYELSGADLEDIAQVWDIDIADGGEVALRELAERLEAADEGELEEIAHRSNAAYAEMPAKDLVAAYQQVFAEEDEEKDEWAAWAEGVDRQDAEERTVADESGEEFVV